MKRNKSSKENIDCKIFQKRQRTQRKQGIHRSKDFEKSKDLEAGRECKECKGHKYC